MKKHITETELRKLVGDGNTHAEIAKMFGQSRSKVAVTCAVLGIKSPLGKGRPRLREYDTSGFLQDMRVGMTLREIALKHSLSTSTIQMHLRRQGLPTCTRVLLQQEAAQQGAVSVEQVSRGHESHSLAHA